LRWRAIAIVVVVIIYGLLMWRDTAQAACQPEPITLNTPTGISGCEVWGEGIASHYGPGYGVAMNYCTWTLRHSKGCGEVEITSLDTGRTVRVPVLDFCDCYTGTDHQRVVDLQYGVVDALGLPLDKGLYPVEVWPVHRSNLSSNRTLPDTSMTKG